MTSVVRLCQSQTASGHTKTALCTHVSHLPLLRPNRLCLQFLRSSPPRKCFLEFSILFSRSLPKIISFFPVIALPLPDNCPLPPSHSSKRRHGADMPTPTCLLSQLTVKFPTILHVRVALHPSFHTLLQRTHDGTLPLMTHWHILSSAPLQGAVVCDESFKELAQTLGAGQISCSAIERQSLGEGDGVGGR